MSLSVLAFDSPAGPVEFYPYHFTVGADRFDYREANDSLDLGLNPSELMFGENLVTPEERGEAVTAHVARRRLVRRRLGRVLAAMGVPAIDRLAAVLSEIRGDCKNLVAMVQVAAMLPPGAPPAADS